MEIYVDHLLKKLRRSGVAIKSVRTGPGRASTQWAVGDVVLNGFAELTAYARGVGAMGLKDSITSRQLRPDERKKAKEAREAAEVDEDTLRAIERFAQTLSGLVFDLSFDGQSEIWRDAVRVAPQLRNTRTYQNWRGRNENRIAADFLGFN